MRATTPVPNTSCPSPAHQGGQTQSGFWFCWFDPAGGQHAAAALLTRRTIGLLIARLCKYADVLGWANKWL